MTTARSTPIWGAARPAPWAAAMVSNMSAIKACSSGVSKCSTGWATRNRRGSPILRISRTAILEAPGIDVQQGQQAVLVEYGQAQFLGLVQLAAGFGPGHDIGGFLGHRTGHLAALGFDQGLGLFTAQAGQ